MAGRARDPDKRTGKSGTPRRSARTEAAGTTEVAPDVRPGRPDEDRFDGHRTATLDLPFVRAQFRVPDLQPPSREELSWFVEGARSMLPSGKSMLFFGGLAATVIAGVIEWPVAAAIGVASAMAGQGGINPEPRGRTAQATGAATSGTSNGA